MRDNTEDSSKKEVEKIIEEHGGMISRDMAVEIASGKAAEGRKAGRASIADLRSGRIKTGNIVELETEVYRVFNKVRFEKDNKERFRRVLVLGKENDSLRVVLWDKHAQLVDSLSIERGDKIIASNLRVVEGREGPELSSTGSTFLSRAAPSNTGISDFSELRSGNRNIDIIGRVVSVSQIRYFVDLDGKQSGVSDCTITDGKIELKLVMWRSSSSCAAEMHPGDYIKVECASVKSTEAGVEISAADTSRILVTSSHE